MAIGVKVRKGSATNARARRAFRVRKKVAGTASRPRLVVSRSSRHLFVQVIDDSIGKTLAYASTMETDLRAQKGDKTAKSKAIGALIASRPRLLEFQLLSLTAQVISTTVVLQQLLTVHERTDWSSNVY